MRQGIQKGVNRFFCRQRGFTLPELLVSLGITAAIGSMLAVAIFQMTNFTSRGNAQLANSGDQRGSMEWLARDIHMAKTTDLVDAAPPVSSMTLNWTDEYGSVGTSHSAAYSLVGTELRRTYDGQTHTVSRNVSAVNFSLNGKIITVTLASADDKWADITAQVSHQFYLRPS